MTPPNVASWDESQNFHAEFAPRQAPEKKQKTLLTLGGIIKNLPARLCSAPLLFSLCAPLSLISLVSDKVAPPL